MEGAVAKVEEPDDQGPVESVKTESGSMSLSPAQTLVPFLKRFLFYLFIFREDQRERNVNVTLIGCLPYAP